MLRLLEVPFEIISYRNIERCMYISYQGEILKARKFKNSQGLVIRSPGESYHLEFAIYYLISNMITIVETYISFAVSGRSIEAQYSYVIMGAIASQITCLTIVNSTAYSSADQHQSFTSLAFVRGIHRWPVNFPHKWPVTRKRFPFGDHEIGVPTTRRRVVSAVYLRSNIILIYATD